MMECMDNFFRNKKNMKEAADSNQNIENGLITGNEEGNNGSSPNDPDSPNIQLPQNDLSKIVTSINTIENKVSDVINRLNRLDIDRLILIQDGMKEIKPSIDESLSSITTIDKKLDNIRDACEFKDNIYRNINEESLRSLQNQISDYKEDLYLKLLSKYVIDINIALFKRIAYRNYDLTKEEQKDNELEKFQKYILQSFLTIGILSFSAKEGQDFDPEFMTVSDYPSIETTDKNLNGKIAFSLIPRFIWALPSLQQQSTSLMLSKEEVILYDIKYI